MLTVAILSKGLTQSKTLDCGGSGEIVLYRTARAPQLNQPGGAQGGRVSFTSKAKTLRVLILQKESSTVGRS